jgi:hypothetical protein
MNIGEVVRESSLNCGPPDVKVISRLRRTPGSSASGPGTTPEEIPIFPDSAALRPHLWPNSGRKCFAIRADSDAPGFLLVRQTILFLAHPKK